MKLVHTVIIKVFVKPGEPDELIRKTLLSLLPFDLDKEKMHLGRTVAHANLSGQSDIIIYEITLEKERHTKKFIEYIRGKLSSDDLKALRTQEDRVDEECSFYMRLDKKKLLAGEYCLTDSGECFHIKMSVAAFPKKRDAALAVVRRIWE